MTSEALKQSPIFRKIIILLALALSSVTAALVLDLSDVIQPLELKGYDAVFYLRAKLWPVPARPASPVIVVGIDDATVTDPAYAAPRVLWHNQFAELIEGLAEAGAKVIGLNFLLPQMMFDDLVPNYSRVWLKAIFTAKSRGTRLITGVVQTESRLLAPEARYLQILGPDSVGLFNLTTDADEFCRRQRLFFPGAMDPQKGAATMAWLVARAFQSDLPMPDQIMTIDFDQRPDAIPVQSFSQVLKAIKDKDAVTLARFKGKIVLIGETDMLTQDQHPTPLYYLIRQGMKRTPGVLIRAQTVNTLLFQRYYQEVGLVVRLVLYLVLCLAVTAMTLFRPEKYLLAFTPGLILLITFASVAAYANLIVLPFAMLVVSVMISQTVSFSYRHWVVEKAKALAEAESAESGRMLGLSFQSQGLLDMAFEKFIHLPVDEALKDILYNLGLDYERKRQFKKAVSVYEYIYRQGGNFKDLPRRIEKLRVYEDGMIRGLSSTASLTADGEILVEGGSRPTLGRYDIHKILGRGAMGVVYLGRDPKINRDTAIKTIRFSAEFDQTEAGRLKEQFYREAETAGRLNHPSIVTVYDVGEDYDLSYLAMEYLDGHTLKEYTKENKLLPLTLVASVVADVAEGLAYAHQQGVVHRDIKPANIMVLKNGRAKVMDFGIAKAMSGGGTRTGMIKGTQLYMSPEQVMGRPLDGRTDIYSLGLVLYELLTGKHPYKVDDLTVLVYKILSEKPAPVKELQSSIPKAFDQILELALAKDREKRYQDAGRMARHLRQVADRLRLHAGPIDLRETLLN